METRNITNVNINGLDKCQLRGLDFSFNESCVVVSISTGLVEDGAFVVHRHKTFDFSGEHYDTIFATLEDAGVDTFETVWGLLNSEKKFETSGGE